MKYLVSTLLVLLLVAWAESGVSVAGDGSSVSKVNGSVRAEAGQSYDSITTVNGDVHLGAGATADEARTVNGEIVVENDVKVGSLKTVNGSLEVGDGASVTREATTVNGSVQLGRRTQVGGDVTTVSGEIELKGSEVTGKLTTINGDIDLTEGAKVRGGIHVKKNNNSNWGWGKSDIPRVHICSTCVVEGDLRFDRPVELRVDTGAKIGKVIGDDVRRL